MPKYRRIFQTAKDALLDLLYPRQDLWTEDPIESASLNGYYLTEDSRRYLYMIHSPICGTCGFPLSGDTVDAFACEHCRHLDPVFESNRSVVLLNRLGRQMVHELKYHRGLYLLRDIELILKENPEIRERIQGHTLVPVPLHPRKLRERGYNQSYHLALVFEAAYGDADTSVRELLVRERDTDSQTLKDRSDRIANVKHAFAVNSKIPVIPDSPVTIVDDVYTTGSTINECASVLRSVGIKQIKSLTFGHG